MQRFTDKITKTNTCWLWAGTKGKGYGKFSFGGKLVPAHRFAYELWVGTIPAGMVIDHTCEIKHCVNPKHLQAVSPRINSQTYHKNRAAERGLVHQPFKKPGHSTCRRGHELTKDNTYHRPDGYPACRVCRNMATSRSRISKRRAA